MIRLPVTFQHDTVDFTQIAREGDVALFRKSKQYPHGSLFESYEVVIVQKAKEACWPDGRITPAHEHMPKPELWGAAGWSPMTLDRAWQKFRELVAGLVTS
jgi:hypothetical protein